MLTVLLPGKPQWRVDHRLGDGGAPFLPLSLKQTPLERRVEGPAAAFSGAVCFGPM
jgi:hypothetical protein